MRSSSVARREAPDDEPREDHFVFLEPVRWSDYERLLEIRGDRSAPRITYIDGVVEIMSPSFDHETIRSLIGSLVEAFCIDRDIDVLPAGSWTIKKRKDKRGAEPDECYVFGIRSRPKRPDLAIEVIWTSGGLDKLEVYKKLGVPEVWIWERGAIHVYLLRGEAFVRAPRSKLLPALDLGLLCKFVDRPSVTRAVRDFRAALARRERRK